MNQEKRVDLVALLLRLGIGTVFLLFGFDKLPHPEKWIVFFPAHLKQSFLSPHTFLKLQGVFEFSLGLALILGFLTRAAGVVASCLLLLILFVLGWDPVAIRDAGLFATSLAIVLMGPGKWSIDFFLEKASK